MAGRSGRSIPSRFGESPDEPPGRKKRPRSPPCAKRRWKNSGAPCAPFIP
jgi:hypothetical protein